MTARHPRISAPLVLLGGGALAGHQLAMFALISRRLGPSAAGEYATSLAISAPAFLLFTGGIRLLQYASFKADRRGMQFVWSRIAGFGASAIISSLVWRLGFDETIGAATLATTLLQRGVDLVSDAHNSLLLTQHQHGLYAFHATARTIAQTAAAVVGVIAGFRLAEILGLVACSGIAVTVILILSGPRSLNYLRGSASSQWASTFTASLTLGISASMASLTINGPRLVIGRGDSFSAAAFTSLILPFSLISLATSAAGQVYIPRLADNFHTQPMIEFKVRLGQYLRLGVLLGSAGFALEMMIAYYGNRLIYGDEFVVATGSILLTSVALFLFCLSSTIQDCLTSMSRFNSQATVFACGATIAVAVTAMAPTTPIVAAIVGLLCAGVAQIALLGIALGRATKSA